MLKKTLCGCAVLGALPFMAAAPAMADINDTTFDTSLTVTPAKAGTKKHPKPLKLTLNMQGGTKSGTGNPSTSQALKVALPSTIKWNGAKWKGTGARCSVSRVNRERSLRSCAKAEIGTGHVDAASGTLNEPIDVTAVVADGGNLGLYLDATSPLPIQTMLLGKVSKSGVINVAIPKNVQEPVTGVKSSIKTLTFTISGTRKVNGTKVGALSSVGCKGGKYSVKTTNVFTDGSLTDTASATCRK